jgi:hydrogenase expression/formation protein HypC
MCLAVPGKLVAISGDEDGPLCRIGRVAFSGVVKDVNLAFAPEARTGDYVLVHAGLAIAVIDEARAKLTIGDLEAMDTAPDGAGRR